MKKCGGSWTITWTAAFSEAGAPAERMGASCEFVIEDLGSDEWFTEGLWLTPLRDPGDVVSGGDFSLDEIACDDPTMP